MDPGIRTTQARSAMMGVVFASGFTALVYEVLWLRALRLLLGSGAQATATTLAIFFAGMAAGSIVFGRAGSRSARPIALYARLESGIAICALAYFALPLVHQWLYPGLVAWLGENRGGLTGMRVILAFVFLFPAAMLMGGTLPVLAEFFVRRPSELARTTGLLYATNTIGAALGALAAGFWMPISLGFRGAYILAITLNLALAAIAAQFSRQLETNSDAPPPAVPARRPRGWLWGYAAASGFATLGLEVLWTRMLALVTNSSVYAFTAILVVFLIALALGALLSARLGNRLAADLHLFVLLLLAGLAVGLSPFTLQALTGGLGSIPTGIGFAPYLAALFANVVVVVLPPAALCGAILPALLRFCEEEEPRIGETVGTLFAINTGGGVLGSLAAGFGLLPVLGLWKSILLLALLYLALGLGALARNRAGASSLRAATLIAAAMLTLFIDFDQLALVRAGPHEETERTWQTPQGILAVTRDQSGRRIRLDNTYVLGGTAGRREERLQSLLPLRLHDEPQKVFLLGLGTGITAAAALQPSVIALTATELLPEVVEASRIYFAQDSGVLFSDPRVQILATDGRTYLATSSDEWDVIVSDLFVPWHEGAGSLYTREHFETVRERLAPDGLFAQWLPLFQLTRSDFDTICRTLLEVFPHVSLWWLDIHGDRPLAVLIAQNKPATVRDPGLEEARFAADLGTQRELFRDAPINTDDRPVLEHRAPLSLAAVRSGRGSWLTGTELEEMLAQVGRPSPGVTP